MVNRTNPLKRTNRYSHKKPSTKKIRVCCSSNSKAISTAQHPLSIWAKVRPCAQASPAHSSGERWENHFSKFILGIFDVYTLVNVDHKLTSSYGKSSCSTGNDLWIGNFHQFSITMLNYRGLITIQAPNDDLDHQEVSRERDLVLKNSPWNHKPMFHTRVIHQCLNINWCYPLVI